MDPLRARRTIQEDDLIIMLESHDSCKPLVVRRGGTYTNKFGTFDFSQLIGKPFGSKVRQRAAEATTTATHAHHASPR